MTRPIAADTESTGLRPYQGDRCTVGSFANDEESWALRPDAAREEFRRIAETGQPVIFHNSPYDRAVISTSFGVEFTDEQVLCSQALDWLLNENLNHSLKKGHGSVGQRWVGLDSDDERKVMEKYRKGPSLTELADELHASGDFKTKKAAREAARIDPRYRQGKKLGWDELGYDDDPFREYAIKDAELVLDAFDAMMLAVDKRRDTPTDVSGRLEKEQRIAGMMYRLTKVGIKVDTARAEKAHADAMAERDRIGRELPDIDLNSAPQVQRWLFEELALEPSRRSKKTGKPSADKKALEQLRWHPDVQRLLDWRKQDKAISSYFFPLLDMQDEHGRVHPSFSAHKTRTGRLSCSGWNAMTIPREDTNAEIGKLFVPEPGTVLLSCDLPNAELRVLADMSKEQAWLDAFELGRDLHQEMADRMFCGDLGCERSGGKCKQHRHPAKTSNYALPYGTGAMTLATTLAEGTGSKPDVAAAKAVIRQYWRAAPRLKRLMDGLSERWQRRGYLPHWTPGRFSHYEGPFGPELSYKALNRLVQGGIANLVIEWMLALEPELPDLGARMVLQKHDSLAFEVPHAEVPRLKSLTQTALDDTNPYSLPFPLDWDEGKL